MPAIHYSLRFTLYDLLYLADFRLGPIEYNVHQYTGPTATERNKTKHTAQYEIPRDTLSQTHAHPRTSRDTLNAQLYLGDGALVSPPYVRDGGRSPFILVVRNKFLNPLFPLKREWGVRARCMACRRWHPVGVRGATGCF